MRQQLIYPLLLIGVFVVAALAASWCAAQDGSGGYGNVPQATGRRAVRAASTSRWFRCRRCSRRPLRVRLPGPAARRARPPPQTPPAGGLPPGELKACNGSRIVAYVGSEVILESDLILRKIDKKGTFEIIGSIDHILEEYKEQFRPIS